MSPRKLDKKPAAQEFLEDLAERVLYGSRWLLAPIYLGLVVGLVIVVIKFFQELIVNVLPQAIESTPEEVVLQILRLLDLGLLANLILIVIFAGYENFVSRMNVAERSEDRPEWMGHIDFSGLKIKLIGSLVAISVIELLQDFMRANTEISKNEGWRVALHLTFVLSGVLFSVMDYIADKRKVMFDAHRKELLAAGHGTTHATGDGL